MKTSVFALILASTVALPQAVHAERPARPVYLRRCRRRFRCRRGTGRFSWGTPSGRKAMSVWPSARATSWAPFGPQATLFNAEGAADFDALPQPDTWYSLLPNPTWQHSRDSSSRVGSGDLDLPLIHNFVAPGAIPWLLLEVAVVGNGPTGGDKLLVRRDSFNVSIRWTGRAPSTGLRQPSGRHEEGTRALRSGLLLLPGDTVPRPERLVAHPIRAGGAAGLGLRP